MAVWKREEEDKVIGEGIELESKEASRRAFGGSDVGESFGLQTNGGMVVCRGEWK
jgi:hypothetical protein